MRWVLLCDRLDRVFSCGKYATPEHSPATTGLDVLFASIPADEQETFPEIEPGIVVRDDLLGSPGWSNGDIRWLLASAEFGGIDAINWRRRSPLKQRTAKQVDPDHDQMSLLDVLMDDPAAAKLRAALERAVELDLTTLVVTHTQDIDTDDRELYIGFPSMEERESAWAWKENLLTSPPGSPSRQALPAERARRPVERCRRAGPAARPWREDQPE